MPVCHVAHAKVRNRPTPPNTRLDFKRASMAQLESDKTKISLMCKSMQNGALNQTARLKNVANMLATLRIEMISPSESLKPALQAYVE